MNKLLFEEVPSKSKEYIRIHRGEKIMLIIMTSVFSLLGVICLFLKFYLVSAFPFLFAIWLGFYVMKAFLQEKQYLYIFDDKICYKNTYQSKETEIRICPSQYTIELKYAMPRSGYTIKFSFRKANGKKLFTYKAISITPSIFQAQKKQWENDLFAIGCAIVDPQEVIKNK